MCRLNTPPQSGLLISLSPIKLKQEAQLNCNIRTKCNDSAEKAHNLEIMVIALGLLLFLLYALNKSPIPQ